MKTSTFSEDGTKRHAKKQAAKLGSLTQQLDMNLYSALHSAYLLACSRPILPVFSSSKRQEIETATRKKTGQKIGKLAVWQQLDMNL